MTKVLTDYRSEFSGGVDLYYLINIHDGIRLD